MPGPLLASEGPALQALALLALAFLAIALRTVATLSACLCFQALGLSFACEGTAPGQNSFEKGSSKPLGAAAGIVGSTFAFFWTCQEGSVSRLLRVPTGSTGSGAASRWLFGLPGGQDPCASSLTEGRKVGVPPSHPPREQRQAPASWRIDPSRQNWPPRSHLQLATEHDECQQGA